MPTAHLEPADNPYRSPASLNPAWETSTSHDYGADELIELRAFVGPRADKYLRKWTPRLDNPVDGDCGFNWAAFFLTSYWLGYRRMYAGAFLVTATFVGLGIGQEVLFVKVLKLRAVPIGVNLIVWAMVHFVCGLYANRWYLTRAQAAVAAAHQQRLEGQMLLLNLVNRGGTSWLGILAAFLFTFLASVIGVMLLLGIHFST